jgi:hypothetical protein
VVVRVEQFGRPRAAGDDAPRPTIRRAGRLDGVLVVVALRAAWQDALPVLEDCPVLVVWERPASFDELDRVARFDWQFRETLPRALPESGPRCTPKATSPGAAMTGRARRASDRNQLAMLPERHAQSVAYLAQRGVGLHRVDDQWQQVLGAVGTLR